MKKFLVFVLISGLLSVIGAIRVSSQSASPNEVNSPVVQSVLPPAMIDDVPVPYEVFIYAQTEYQGYAITHAKKITRGGQQLYQLQVSRDDAAPPWESIYLLYDMEWKLIGDEKLSAPPRPAQAHTEEEPKPQQEEIRESDDDDDEKPQPDIGGNPTDNEGGQDEQNGGNQEDNESSDDNGSGGEGSSED